MQYIASPEHLLRYYAFYSDSKLTASVVSVWVIWQQTHREKMTGFLIITLQFEYNATIEVNKKYK